MQKEDKIMEVASIDGVELVMVLDRLGRGLDQHISSYAARRCLHKTSLASREERSCRLVKARVVLVEHALLPGLVRGLIPERQPVKTNDGGPHGPDVG